MVLNGFLFLIIMCYKCHKTSCLPFCFQVWQQNDKENILKLLVCLFQVPNILPCIIRFLPNLLPELFFRVITESMITKPEAEQVKTLNIILKLIPYRNINICCHSLSIYFNNISKCIKSYQNSACIILFFKAVYSWCVKSGNLPVEFCNEDIICYFKDSKDFNIRFYIYKLLALNYGVIDTDSYLQKHFTYAELNQCEEMVLEEYPILLQQTKYSKDIASINVHKSFQSSDFKSNFIFFFGIPLFVLEKENLKQPRSLITEFVLTSSTLKNLQSLVYGYMSNRMVVLSGDIGCGKTMIIQNLFAKLMGRIESPKLLKLQLGEQTDSKVLILTSDLLINKLLLYRQTDF